MSSAGLSEPIVQPHIGARQFASTFATNVTIQMCTVVQGILLARTLGPTGRGQFAAAVLWPTVFAAVGGMGVSVALARRGARTQDLSRIVRTGILLSLATGIIATTCCALALPWLMMSVDDVSRISAWYFLPFIVFNHVATGLVAIDHGAARFKQYNLTRLIVNPAYLILIVWLWLIGVNQVAWFVVCLLAANGIVALARVGLAAREYSLIGPIESLSRVVREALPFGAAGFITPFLESADKALLLYMLGTTELGLYTVAMTASSVANGLAAAAASVSFGIAARMHDPDVFQRVARIFRMTAWIWLLTGACAVVAIPILMPLMYGNAFRPAIWPAILLIPAAALSGQAGILEESLRAQGRAFIGLEARVAELAAFLIVGWILTRHYGVIGTAIAFGFAQAVALVIMVIATSSHFSQGTLRDFVPRARDLRELAFRLRTKLGTLRLRRS